MKKIEETIIAQVPSYLELIGGNLVKVYPKNDSTTYKILDCSVKVADPLQLGFHGASDMFEAEIHVEDSGSRNVHSVIVKTVPSNAFLRAIQNSVDQFFNESKMYSEIIPLLLQTIAKSCCGGLEAERLSGNLSAVCDLFPKCYYVSPDPENGMIVLQDLRPLGYKIGGDKTMFLDYDHIVVALEGLARYHALSYGMKKKDFGRYEQHVVTQVRDARRILRKESESNFTAVGFPKFVRHGTMLILDKFNEVQLKEGGLYAEKVRRVQEKVESFAELLRELATPEEPLSVLCHGDFNMNNMLFQYDSNGRPTGVKFLDFQTPYYASPAIDISFFLFMNASPKIWANCWDGLFSAYHQTLLDALSEFLNCPQEELLPDFSLEAFKEQFSKYCLYGFLVATSFIVAHENSDMHDMKSSDAFRNGIVPLEDLDIFLKENIKLPKAEVIDRVLHLTRELLDKICL
jgi:hypothetical protein